MSKWAVVVPTCRPKKYEEFLKAWQPWFDHHKAELIPVFDDGVWEGIPDFIPRRTDMIRSWGFYQAWKTDCDYVLSLDDDVLPRPIFSVYEDYFQRKMPCLPYLSVGALSTAGPEMRGFPYEGRWREVVVQYGGWHGVADLDGQTQLQAHRVNMNSRFHSTVIPVPKGCAVTCCAMNFAFKREYAPIMWQLPLHGKRFNRFGDIWSGLIQKRVLDLLDKVMLINGRASVTHERASDPLVNAEKEAPGLEPNERLWEYLDISGLDTDKITAFYFATQRMAIYLKRFNGGYAKHFLYCRDKWLELFQ